MLTKLKLEKFPDDGMDLTYTDNMVGHLYSKLYKPLERLICRGLMSRIRAQLREIIENAY